MATILGRFSIISGTRTLRTPCAIRIWRRIDLRVSGETKGSSLLCFGDQRQPPMLQTNYRSDIPNCDAQNTVIVDCSELQYRSYARLNEAPTPCGFPDDLRRFRTDLCTIQLEELAE